VKVRRDEGVANRIGPEPCGGIREGSVEASAGERIGQPLSRESLKVSGADVVGLTEGNMDGRLLRAPDQPGVVKETGMCGSSLHGNREVSGLARGGMPQVRVGKTRSRSR
jgi:hypothetical protein